MDIVTEGPHWCRATVYQEEDWIEALPAMIDPVNGDPFDLTGMVLDLFVRPTFDYAGEPILFISSSAATGDRIIVETPATAGLVTISVEQATMASLPHHRSDGGWEHFLTLRYTDETLGAVIKTLWRGPFIIRPGNRDED